MKTNQLPVAIIGAGPIGLAAAAHLLKRGETPIVFEAGPSVGAAVLQWGHIRLFSPWRYLIDRQAAALLEADGWLAPDPVAYPTGRELVGGYLIPLAEHPRVQPHLHLNTRVVAVTRQGVDKMKTPGREKAPFVLRLQTASGEEQDVLARAVIDASGTYETPNPLGAHGIPALGERALRERIFYGIPDILGTQRERYAGRRVLVVGSGHSAFNALLELAALAQEHPSTHLLWAIRRTELHQLFGGRERDALPARGELGQRIQALVESGKVRLVTGVHISALHQTAEGIVIVGEEERLGPVDEIIATTGFRPDLSVARELRLALDASLESPVALAPLIDPNVHSCGTVPPHGVDELSHLEEHFYIVGMKSYGRAPTFLTLTGYEQVRSIVSALTGDWEAARRVELVLPETGVCSTDAGGSCAAPSTQEVTSQDDLATASASCCGTPPARQLLTVGAARSPALHAFLLRRHPEDLGLSPDGEPALPVQARAPLPGATLSEALGSPIFWMLTASLALVMLGSTVVFVHQVAFMISRGTDAVLGATLSGMLGLASLPGRYVFNVLSSRISPQKLLTLSVVAQAVGIVVLVQAFSPGWLILYVAIYGSAYGAFSPLRASVMADHFGRRAYGAITAVQGIPVALCAGLGPLAAGWLYDGLHHYDVAFWLCACAFLPAAIGIALAPRPKEQYADSGQVESVMDEEVMGG